MLMLGLFIGWSETLGQYLGRKTATVMGECHIKPDTEAGAKAVGPKSLKANCTVDMSCRMTILALRISCADVVL